MQEEKTTEQQVTALTKTAAIAKAMHLDEVVPSKEPGRLPAVTIANEACLLLRGDNLDALHALMKAHSGAVDFCYIDPPYNTGAKFIYDDKRLSPESGVWGRHGAWLSFMLPRLVLMHGLLKDSGLAAVSIDDYEYAHLKILLDQVFGEENYLGTLIVHRSKNGKGSKAHIAVSHEEVLLYGKSAKAKIIGLPELDIESYTKQDAHGRYKVDGLFRKKGEASMLISTEF